MPSWLRVAGAAWLVLALAFPTLPTALQASSFWPTCEENSSEREEDPLPEVQDLLLGAMFRSQHTSRSAVVTRPNHLSLRPLDRAVERPAACEFARRNGVGSVLRC